MGLQTTMVHGAQYKAENGNLREFGSTYRHGVVFAPKQCLYQKKVNGIVSMWCICTCIAIVHMVYILLFILTIHHLPCSVSSQVCLHNFQPSVSLPALIQ